MRLPRRNRDPDVVRTGGIASGIDVNRQFRWLTSYAGFDYRAAKPVRGASPWCGLSILFTGWSCTTDRGQTEYDKHLRKRDHPGYVGRV